MKHPQSRNSIFQEEARVLEHHAHPGEQYMMRLHAPETAAYARPGSFIHLQCAVDLPMRRPMSIMRADKLAGWVDILYKVHGEGTAKLAQRKNGDLLSVLGPIGLPFKLENYQKFPLLIGGGVGIPPMVFLAEHIRKTTKDLHPFVIIGSEIPFPFKPRPSQIMVSGIPDGVIAAMPLLEDWGIASRLTSLQGYAGCFDGYVTELAKYWLNSLEPGQRNDVEIFSCGPTAMLRAVSQLAHEFSLPCQISLEEFMACAVGGCAGCVVEVHTENGPAMKRVCVDGPVFEATSIFPQNAWPI